MHTDNIYALVFISYINDLKQYNINQEYSNIAHAVIQVSADIYRLAFVIYIYSDPAFIQILVLISN